MAVAPSVPSTASPSPVYATAGSREHEIDEIMQFLRFSVKPSSTFDGTILFKFKGDNGTSALSYAVEVTDDKHVKTHKNATATDVRAACEVTISVDDFLYIYSGKASSTDIVKLFYAGKVAISGYAFRTVSAFAQSFDFSSDAWRSFYTWRDTQQHEAHNAIRAPSAVDEARNVGSPSRDFWFAHCRSVLDRYNVSKLTQLQWATSMASVCGEQFVLANVARTIHTPLSHPVATTVGDNSLSDGANSSKWMDHATIATVLGAHPAIDKRSRRPLTTSSIAPTTKSSDMQYALAAFLNPCTKQTASFVDAVRSTRTQPLDVFRFCDDAFVDAVKATAQRRFHVTATATHKTNRVDLADAGMAQLDKLVQAIGRGGHCNRTNNKQSTYVPAPELLLREFHGNANSVMDLLREKALGRKALAHIPSPDVDWLVGGARTASVLLVGDSRPAAAAAAALSTAATVSMQNAVGSSSNSTTQSLVEVNRAGLQRRRSRRGDFALPKQQLKAKFASISRDLVLQQQQSRSAIMFATVEDHLVFSDYL